MSKSEEIIGARALRADQFRDALGDAWTCRPTTRVLREATLHYDVSLVDLQSPHTMAIGKLLGLLWYSVRDVAVARGVTQSKFEEECVPPRLWGGALSAIISALTEAFPREEEQSDGDAPLPETRGEAKAGLGAPSSK